MKLLEPWHRIENFQLTGSEEDKSCTDPLRWPLQNHKKNVLQQKSSASKSFKNLGNVKTKTPPPPTARFSRCRRLVFSTSRSQRGPDRTPQLPFQGLAKCVRLKKKSVEADETKTWSYVLDGEKGKKSECSVLQSSLKMSLTGKPLFTSYTVSFLTAKRIASKAAALCRYQCKPPITPHNIAALGNMNIAYVGWLKGKGATRGTLLT